MLFAMTKFEKRSFYGLYMRASQLRAFFIHAPYIPIYMNLQKCPDLDLRYWY